jgi:hypothetical protein
MAASDIGMLALVVGALVVFAGALGLASWLEAYGPREKR